MRYEKKWNLQLRGSLFTLMAGLVLVGLLLPPSSRASVFDKKTILTFSGHVQFPGVILGAGTYVVKRVDWGQPDILIIMNSEENHSYAMVHTIPIQRARPTDDVEVTFYETRGLAAPAVKALFYPGEITGEQFIYRKGGPVLMGLTGETVTTDSSMASAGSAKEAEVTTTTTEEAKVEQPAEPERTEMAQATNPAPMPSSRESAEEHKELPKTASDLPLLALVGMLALAAGGGLKRLARS